MRRIAWLASSSGHRALGRVATGSLVVLALCACLFTLWAGRANYQATMAIEHESRLANAYQEASVALADENATATARSSNLDPNVVDAFDREGNQFTSGLNGILMEVDPSEQASIWGLLGDHASYRLVANRFRESPMAADDNSPQATFQALQQRLTALNISHRQAARDRMTNLIALERFTGTVAPGIIAAGLACTFFLFVVVRSYEGAVADALAREREQVMSLAGTEQRFRALLANTSDVILVIDELGVVRYLSPVADRHTPGLCVGDNALKVVLPEDHATAQEMVGKATERPHADVKRELRIVRPDGSYRFFDVICTNQQADPSIRGFVLTCHDVTERKAFEDRLKDLAFLDPLTRLPNRAFFLEHLGHVVRGTGAADAPVTLMFLDLDNFKLVNDSLGHSVGDTLLVAVADRIRECLNAQDVAARLGGDEFTILFRGASNALEAIRLASRVANALRVPIELAGQNVVVTSSIGIAVGIPGVDTPEDLLRNADLAMYHAKTQGTSQSVVYDESMKTVALERMQLESDLRQAIERQSLELVYQPIFSLATGKVVELEALIRWDHPTRGRIAPSEFIPIAEETGLIVPLGQWILDEACRQTRNWHDASDYLQEITTSVNISARQVQSPTLVEDVRAALERVGLSANHLKLELTESAIMSDAEQTIDRLRELNRLGIRVAIDDFGTGYSSLSYITRFMVDTLKIDRSFVEGVGEDESNTAIVRSIISLAKSLGLGVTGEGIESTEQLERLKAFGCDGGQGYLFARPLAADAVPAFLLGRSYSDSEELQPVAA